MSETYSTSNIEGSKMKKRMSQRQPLACRACTKSKVRCDKNIPCARCFRRDILCEREAVHLSTKRHRKPASISGPEHQLVDGIPSRADEQSSPAEIHKSLPCVPTTHSGAHSSQATTPAMTSTLNRGSNDLDCSQVKFEDLATCIEGLAWGRHQCHKYPHRNCLRFEAHTDISRTTSHLEDVLEKLPDVRSARSLVDFHVRLLGWYHNVLHIPTFLAQCEKFWHSAYIEDGQWLALYCAILCASAWSIHNSPECQDIFGVLDTSVSPAGLFELVGVILNREDFMSRHTIFSLQSICISGMVANVLGKSDLLVTWLSASVRIAQCLGLHRIWDRTTNEPWIEALEKEVGRRVWWKLVEMDYHSIPYTGSYSINLRHCSTKPPGNCDDDLQIQGEEVLTSSTYALTQAKMAVLIPALLDGPSARDDLASRYEHVIAIDRQMRQLVAAIPLNLLRQSNNGTSGPEWLTLARRTLAIAAADKIIMIHRSFLLKSFQSPAYLFTRQTCVSAARTILREHDEISRAGPECPPLWVHSAFCVAAIVVICLDLLYCHNSLASERKDNYVQLIRSARQRLALSKNDTMARRGVYLVDAMLNEELYSDPNSEGSDENTSRHRFTQILHRFIQSDQHERSSMRYPEPSNLDIREQSEDFDIWFNSHFR